MLPSHAYETLGKTILESYAQARGVVATDLGSRREFVKHGETGLLYGVGNIEQLSVVTVQGLDWQRKKWGRTASNVLRAGEYAAIRFPHETMVVSHTLQDYFQSRYPREPRYIANGAVLRRAGSHEHIQRWSLERRNYILFLGRFPPKRTAIS